MKKFKKIIVLDTIIFYPEHRKILESLAEEVVEYPSSLLESLAQQLQKQPELFKNLRCYTELGTNNIPLQLLQQRVEGADVVLSCWTGIPDEILRLNPQLKLVIFWTHEKEHRINVSLAEERGVIVRNIPDYGTEAVAELVFAGLFEVLVRNFSPLPVQKENNLGVLHDIFQRLRLYQKNEKNTREGKFTHHFHKLGEATFDFRSKSLEELIPEKLVLNRRVGLLNFRGSDELKFALQAFGVRYETFELTDSHNALYYKFLTENGFIVFDSSQLHPVEVRRLNVLFPQKLVDLKKTHSFDYPIHEKTFGIIGLGRIGTEVAKTARALGFSVQYYSRTRKTHVEKEIGVTYSELADLARSSDVISLHVPAYHADNLINHQLISFMKAGTILINTADGNAVDTPELSKRMFANEIFCALDVYPGLPRKDVIGLPMKNQSDWKIKNTLPNHLLTYRAGWRTQESIRVKTYKLLGFLADFLIKASS